MQRVLCKQSCAIVSGNFCTHCASRKANFCCAYRWWARTHTLLLPSPPPPMLGVHRHSFVARAQHGVTSALLFRAHSIHVCPCSPLLVVLRRSHLELCRRPPLPPASTASAATRRPRESTACSSLMQRRRGEPTTRIGAHVHRHTMLRIDAPVRWRRLSEYERACSKADEAQAALNERDRLLRSGQNAAKVPQALALF